MGATARIFDQALRLPPTARARLAGRLVRSLDEGNEDPRAVKVAWAKEVARRVREVEAGSVELLSEEEADRVLMSSPRARSRR